MLEDEFRKTRVANDLMRTLAASADKPDELHAVIIEVNASFAGGEAVARALLLMQMLGSDLAREAHGTAGFAIEPLLKGVDTVTPAPKVDPDQIKRFNSMLTERYVFADLTTRQILQTALATAVASRIDPQTKETRPGEPVYLVHRIWPNEDLEPLVFVSSRTIKCDAARAAFNSAGRGIVWAIADTGVQPQPHFRVHGNLELPNGLDHWDFTGPDGQDREDAIRGALTDEEGHGTHVAGIIAGRTQTREKLETLGRGTQRAELGVAKIDIRPEKQQRLAPGNPAAAADEGPAAPVDDETEVPDEIAGVAPFCKLMSLKVLKRRRGPGKVDNLIAAINHIQRINGHGSNIKVHGLNISLGYRFNVDQYAAGQSPLCAEVNRLVRCGVVVVVAAGNGGGGTVSAVGGETPLAAHLSTISDPGNAEHAITVGSTHRERPHTFGVSFFSAKGPTMDGRMKPDLVAPGERIVSCDNADPADNVARFRRESGTSMAAPHVSGAIAAFLSVRREFRGQPDRVKQLFMENATDLRRRPEYQGAGLIDLMRTLQAV